MKNKSPQLFILMLFFVLPQAYSQLSGYYIIGGTNANYETLSQAITDLHEQGIDDDVTFALNPGIYPGITFTEIPGASVENSFVLESTTLNSTDVIIESTISFDETSYISINALIISTGLLRAIDFIKSKHIYINNCVLSSSYPESYADGSIKIAHFWPDQGDYSYITLNHCSILSTEQSIYCSGYNGYTTINDCEIYADSGIAIEASWCKRVNINNCTLNGGLSFDWTSISNLRNNLISGIIDISPTIDSVINNTFISNETIRLSATYLENNHFYGLDLDIMSEHYKFINNYCEPRLYTGHATNIQMVGNTFMDNISLSFNEVLLFESNKVYGDFNYGNTNSTFWDFRIFNNIFYNGYLRSGGHNSIISHNNFVDNAYLYVNYSDISVHDNNFCRAIEGSVSSDKINHNNYFPLIYCFYDTNSTHYDPMYLEDTPGIATNPLLQGKGWYDAPDTDFLGNLRKSPPAIGANEIYLCSDSVNNPISVPCGDEVYLNMCGLQDAGNYWWAPDTCLLHSDSLYTAVTACESMTWYLNNSIYGIVDSVSIQVVPFEVQIAEMPVFYCGYARTLNASYHPFASYHWTPEDGLTNPYIRNPDLLLEDTNNLQYILECQINGCEVSYDTLNIYFDPLPNVEIHYPQQNADTTLFTSTSTCADEYLWDFGDGTFSTEENPFHVFPEDGLYTVTLTVTNSFGSNSHIIYYYHYWVSSSGITENENIIVFPNPADERIFIKGLPEGNEVNISLMNLSGDIIIRTKNQSDQVFIDIQDLAKGAYIMQIQYDETIITKRIIVLP